MKPTKPKSWTAIADHTLLAVALVILIAGATGGPGWMDASHQAVLATQLERAASAPLHGVLAQVAAHLPAGEPGFRLGLLGAVLGALTLLGVLRAARALLPKDPVATALAPLLLVLAPPFRDAAAVAAPTLLAACGVTWTIALAATHARAPSVRVRGSRRARSSTCALLVATSGRGAAAVVVGAGLLGAAFGAATGLPAARWLALALAIAAASAIVVDHDPTVLLALLAIGAAIIPGAVVRVIPRQRHVVAAAAIVPLGLAAVLAGPAITVDDPADAPARLATDLTADLPAGPVVFVSTRPTTFAALEYAQRVAGDRPDLLLVPPLPPATVDVVVKNALVTNRIAAADTFTPGQLLEPRWSFPRGRAFQLLGAEPATLAAIRPPARYASAVGEAEAVTLALALATYETVFGRFDAAAHAAGLKQRFGAADLALLATAAPIHRTLLDYLPAFGTPTGPWLLQLLGDDLAWRVGLDVPAVDGPPARALHALWRELLVGQRTADDPAIAALGPAAVDATRRLVADSQPAPAPPAAAPPTK